MISLFYSYCCIRCFKNELSYPLYKLLNPAPTMDFVFSLNIFQILFCNIYQLNEDSFFFSPAKETDSPEVLHQADQSWVKPIWVSNERKLSRKKTKELSLCHKLKFSNPYIFTTGWRRPLIFQTYNIWCNRIHSLKYLRFTTVGYKDIRIRKFEFVTKTQFLYFFFAN